MMMGANDDACLRLSGLVTTLFYPRYGPYGGPYGPVWPVSCYVAGAVLLQLGILQKGTVSAQTSTQPATEGDVSAQGNISA